MTLPAIPESFEWAQSSCGLVLKCRPLEAIAPHVFTTRAVPLSSSDDWRLLARALGAEGVVTAASGPWPGCWSDETRIAASPSSGQPATRSSPTARRSLWPFASLTAFPYCWPMHGRGAVAAVHAGWRGVAAGTIGSAIEALVREFGTSPVHVHAAIGPAIGSCCYEVGSDLVDAFAAAGHARHLIDRWFHSSPALRGRFSRGLESGARSPLRLDLPGASRDQLVLAGVAGGADSPLRPVHCHASGCLHLLPRGKGASRTDRRRDSAVHTTVSLPSFSARRDEGMLRVVRYSRVLRLI